MTQLTVLPEEKVRTGRPPPPRVSSGTAIAHSAQAKQPIKPRILFVGEGVTLAHVVRPLQLASNLKAKGYDVILACDQRYRRFVEEKDLTFEPLDSISPNLLLIFFSISEYSSTNLTYS